MAKNALGMGKVVEECKACPKWLSWTHVKRNCPKKGRPFTHTANGVKCTKYHDSLLLSSKSKYCEAAHVEVVDVNAVDISKTVLLAQQEIPAAAVGKPCNICDPTQCAIVFWDTGSAVCICTHQWAASREIVGKPKAVFIKCQQEA